MTPVRAGARLLPAVAAILLLTACDGGGSEAGQPSASHQLDLATGEPLFTITLAPGDAQSGVPWSIAAGDFNGDGKQDLLIGAPYSNGPDGSRPGAGEAYVLLGPLRGDVDLGQKQPDVRILGAVNGDALGSGVTAGDLNGDGLDDVIIGAPNSNALDNERTDMGEAYVIFGRPNMPAVVDALAAQQDFTLQPAEGFAQLGRTFGVGDVNGDGIADLIAGAPYAGREADTPPGGPRTTIGEVYIVYGKHDLGGVVAVARDREDVRLSGIKQYDQFGGSVAAADVNGDGVADVVAGASGYDGPSGRDESGGVFVFYGHAGLPRHATLNEADLRLSGGDAADAFGTLVAAADLNGDGRAELIAGSPGGAGPRNDRPAAGEVLIVDPAKVAGPNIDLGAPSSATWIYAPSQGELMPSALAVSAKGSLVAIGSSTRVTPEREGAGWTYVVAGPLSDHDLSVDPSQLTVQGATAGDGLGAAIAFADLNGDGSTDLLVLAADGTQPMGEPRDFRSRVYVFRPG